MPRYCLTIEYNGQRFYGLQRQDGLKTVQGEIEIAAGKFCGEKVTLHAAGRTDTGVHALGQVVHFDLSQQVDPFRLQQALNFYLNNSGVVVLEAKEVDDTFHARFSARARQYCYRIVNRRSALTIDNGRAWHVIQPLDAVSMQEAAQYLVGTHDFTSFRSAHCQGKSPLKTLEFFSVERFNNAIELRVKSGSFLHNQVRIMVGSLCKVGKGLWTPQKINEILAAKDRTLAGQTAPSEGLYFEKVYY